jgi:4-hydroxyacetophenone monooxygenase
MPASAPDGPIAGKRSAALTDTDIRQAVDEAAIPELLMVVYQVTGDDRWLGDRYRPKRGKGLGPRDTGLEPLAEQEIRDAAVPAIRHLLDGNPPALVELDPQTTTMLVSFFLGEKVEPRYGPILAEELNRRSARQGDVQKLPDVQPPEGLEVIVIGMGIAGIAAIHMLQQLGLGCTVFERNRDAGGVWHQNNYPGAGVDTPSHLYSFSFSYRDWEKHFELRDQLYTYFNDVLDQLGARDQVHFETEVLSADYGDDTSLWRVVTRTADGATQEHLANIVISAVGSLNKPRLPDVPGRESFQGKQFHSNLWPETYDLTGKRVAVVGVGASAQQIVPEIAPTVEHLTILQRSPQWAAPFEQFRQRVPDAERKLLEAVPLYRAWKWVGLFWQFGDKIIEALRIDPDWEFPERSVNARNDGHRGFFTRYIAEQLAGRPDLIAKATPTYPPFGKRMLLDNGWYQTLKRDNVSLVTEGVSAMDEAGLVDTAGRHEDFDVVIWATGFEATHFLSSFDVHGEKGIHLRDVWDLDDPRAYLGVSIPHFPNFFMLGGPHSLPGSGSFMYFMELQARYLRDLLAEMFRKGITAIDATDEVTDRYNELVDEVHSRTVWSHEGFGTYYRNSKGRVIFVMPFLNVEYWEFVHTPDLNDYTIRDVPYVAARAVESVVALAPEQSTLDQP